MHLPFKTNPVISKNKTAFWHFVCAIKQLKINYEENNFAHNLHWI